jgi:hypothetical protein
MIVTVRYRDVPWEESSCRHMTLNRSIGETRKLWEGLRGRDITIDLATFHAGECPTCDSWLIVPTDIPNLCAIRGSLEIGD